jgi:division protein CdvB (Snf7/Vps24/ESCRT-III family)
MAPSSALGMLSPGGDKNIREKINHTIREIELQRRELEQLRFRLEERRVAMFNATVRAVENSDDMRARVFAGEHIELQKVTKVVNASELALLHIIVRLETLRDVGDVTVALSTAFKEVKRINKSIKNIAPDLEASAREVNQSFADLLAELGILSPDINIALSDTPEEIFQKAQRLIEEKTSELSELPASIEKLTRQEASNVLENTKRIALLASGEVPDEAGEEDDSELKPSIFVTSLKSVNNQTVEMARADPEAAIRKFMREHKTDKIDVIDCSAQLNLPVDLVEHVCIKLLSEKKKGNV